MLRLLPFLTLLALPSMAQAQLARYCSNNALELASVRSNATVLGLEYIAVFRNVGRTTLNAVTINYRGSLTDKPTRPITFAQAGSADSQRQVTLGRATPGTPRLLDAQVTNAIAVSGC